MQGSSTPTRTNRLVFEDTLLKLGRLKDTQLGLWTSVPKLGLQSVATQEEKSSASTSAVPVAEPRDKERFA